MSRILRRPSLLAEEVLRCSSPHGGGDGRQHRESPRGVPSTGEATEFRWAQGLCREGGGWAVPNGGPQRPGPREPHSTTEQGME